MKDRPDRNVNSRNESSKKPETENDLNEEKKKNRLHYNDSSPCLNSRTSTARKKRVSIVMSKKIKKDKMESKGLKRNLGKKCLCSLCTCITNHLK